MIRKRQPESLTVAACRCQCKSERGGLIVGVVLALIESHLKYLILEPFAATERCRPVGSAGTVGIILGRGSSHMKRSDRRSWTFLSAGV